MTQRENIAIMFIIIIIMILIYILYLLEVDDVLIKI